MPAKYDAEYKMRKTAEMIIRLSRRLRLLSLMIVTTLLLSLSSLVLRVYLYDSWRGTTFWSILCFAGMLLNIVGIVLLQSFDHMKKTGKIMYDELSDEVEWGYRTSDGKPRRPPNERLDIDLRVYVRRLLLANELPLVPGNYGQGIYLVLFILIMIVHLIMPLS